MRELTVKALGAGAVLTAVISIAATPQGAAQQPASTPLSGQERHLTNIRQLTSGGENAEAYFSPDGTHLIFQSTRQGYPCDQIFTVKIDGTCADTRSVNSVTSAQPRE